MSQGDMEPNDSLKSISVIIQNIRQCQVMSLSVLNATFIASITASRNAYGF